MKTIEDYPLYKGDVEVTKDVDQAVDLVDALLERAIAMVRQTSHTRMHSDPDDIVMERHGALIGALVAAMVEAL